MTRRPLTDEEREAHAALAAAARRLREAQDRAESNTGSREAELNLSVSAEDARAMHRVVRALHDGHCPSCGALHDSRAVKLATRHECPSCHFYITNDEAKQALDTFHDYMRKCCDIFIKNFGPRDRSLNYTGRQEPEPINYDLPRELR